MINTPASERPALVYLALIGATLFWGLSFVATKVALESFTALNLLLIRFILASGIFVVLLSRLGWPKFTRSDHLKLAGTALVQPFLYFLLETFSLSYAPASKVSLIIATIPVVVLGACVAMGRERVTWISLAGVVLSLAGIVLLVGGDPNFSFALGGSLLGDALALGAVFTAAAYMIAVRSFGGRHPALHVTAMQMLYGTLYFIPYCLIRGGIPDLSGVTGAGIAALVYLVVLATIGAFFCYNYALARVEASKASLFINGVPVVTAIAGWLLLGERLAPLQLAGGGLVLFAVFFTNAMNRNGRAAAESAPSEA